MLLVLPLFRCTTTALQISLFRLPIGMTNTVDIVESPFNSLVMVQQAGSKGRGLFAKTFIPKGTLIGQLFLVVYYTCCLPIDLNKLEVSINSTKIQR